MTVPEVHLLDDDPAQDDLFGPHSKLAKAITRLITGERNGRTIALEGPWGSGKSTVIGMLASELEGEEQISPLVFVFDAWVHQGDPLRRSFLEALLGRLEAKGWVNDKNWIERSSELAGRRSDSTVTTTPRLTIAGKVLATAALVTPFGLVVLNYCLTNGVRGWREWVTFLASGAIALAVVGLLIIKQLLPESRRSDFDPMTPLTSSYTKVETTENVERGDPTSIEFESFFNDLTAEALTSSDRRLVIVLDNVDRVPTGDALSMLSTLQTFRPTGRKPWSGSLWTIVPFDIEGLETLWGDRNIATNFLEKMIDVRFPVPPLVLTDWRRFLESQLLIAFPTLSSEDIRTISAVYQAWLIGKQGESVGSGAFVTPRSLKRFVNNLGAVVRTGIDVPAAVAGLYVLLLREHGNSLPSTLITQTAPIGGKRIPALLGSNWRVQVAALFYGTDLGKASQLLLDTPIRNALIRGESKELRQLQAVEGFWLILESREFELWADNGSVDLGEAVAALQSAGLLDADEAVTTRRLMTDAFVAARKWVPITTTSASGLGRLARFAIQSGSLSWSDLGEHFSMGQNDGIGSSLREPKQMAEVFQAFFSGLETPSADQGSTLSIGGDARAFVDFCGFISVNDSLEPFWHWLRSEASTAEILETLAQLNGLSSPDFVMRNQVQVVRSCLDDWDPSTLLSAITGLFKTGDLSDQSVVGQALGVVQVLGSESDHVVSDLVSSGEVLHMVHLSQSAGAFFNVGQLMIWQLSGSPALTDMSPPNKNSADGFALLQQVLAEPSNFDPIVEAQAELVSEIGLDVLERIVEGNGTTQVWASAVLDALSEGEFGELLTVDQFIKKWALFERLLSTPRLNAVVSEMLSMGLIESLIAENPGDWLGLTTILSPVMEKATVTSKEASGSVQYVEWAKRSIQEMDRDDWIAELEQSDSPVWELVMWLDRRGKRPSLGLQLENALADHGHKLAMGETTFIPRSDTWRIMLSTLTEAGSKTSLAVKLTAEIADRRGDIAPAFFDVYGDFLGHEDAARKHARMVQEVIEAGIEKSNLAEITGVIEVAEEFSDFLPSSDSEAGVHLRVALESALEEAAPDSALFNSLVKLQAILPA